MKSKAGFIPNVGIKKVVSKFEVDNKIRKENYIYMQLFVIK